MLRFLRARWLLVGILLGVIVAPATGQRRSAEPQFYALLPHDCPLIRICWRQASV